MFTEVLTSRQNELLPVVASFSKDFYLAGGTAIALTIGHRRSIDFDLFTNRSLMPLSIKNRFKSANIHYKILQEAFDQLHLLVDDVKLTFFNFPYEVPAAKIPGYAIRMPELLTLSAMKALALGGRAKWKDYVDIYFILKYHFPLKQVADVAAGIFPEAFSEKLFRQQLAYFEDIDYSEKVIFMKDAVPDDEIRRFLSNQATENF
ncbi:MAG: nucleotidyl transferase AbiEii/AbiGii toxin family protein [Bacteroidales bacterium]|nr:nucleotidyl transferase AbiEii/AbiGii toxin family protein [Bacteroidales bacterium]